MKISISGASGQLGAAAVKHLTKRVHPADLVGIPRTPEKVAVLGIDARPGDFDRPESLD